MLIREAIILIEHVNTRKEIEEELGASSALISQWKSSEKNRIPMFDTAAKIYGKYNIVVYPYNESDLLDRWSDIKSIS